MSNNNCPLVSVIIPTFKRSDSLCRTIDSVLAQTYPRIEIIVVDDNGIGTEHQHKTEVRLRDYIISGKINYLKHEVNKNGSAARNTGFGASKGEFINFLDDDDIFMPTKIEEQVMALNTYCKEYNAVYCRCRIIKESVFRGKYEVITQYDRCGNLIHDYLLEKTIMNTSALLFRRSVIEELNGFDESYYRLQDFELMTRFFMKNEVGCAGDSYLMTYDLSIDRVNFPNLNKLISIRQKFLDQFKKQLIDWQLLDTLSKKWWLNNADVALRIKDYTSFKYCIRQSANHGHFYISDLFYLFKAFVKGVVS